MALENILAFIKEVDLLKKVERQALIHSGGRRENTAEHSWHLAIAVMVLEPLAAKGVNIDKAIKLALLHDIAEIDAGDTFVYGDLSGKADAELKAAKRLTSLLPSPTSTTIENLWLDFEGGESLEAIYVSAIDRFLPIYSNYLNQGYSWKNHNVSSAQIIAKCEAPISKGIPSLWEVAKEMMEESIAKGYLRR